jgi:hypothetical protein
MRSKYSEGIIYYIISADGKLLYIGSTRTSLKTRIIKHKSGCKTYFTNNKKRYCSSYKIIKDYEYTYHILERFPCFTKKELEARERYHLDIFKEYDCFDICNTNNVGNSIEDNQTKLIECKIKNKEKYKLYQDDYRTNHKEDAKQYVLDNKDKTKLYQSEYRNTHRENEKQYRLDNKDSLSSTHKKINAYKISFGGDMRSNNNNLLKIDPTIFH